MVDAAALGTDSWRGWVVVAVAFVSMFTVFGVAYSFGAFFEPMASEFGTGSGATSLVFSITSFVYFLLGSVSGAATDRYGPRRVLVVAAVAIGLGLLLTSRVQALWVGYLTYGAGVGIGVACGYVPMVATVSGWFVRRRGVALGVAVSGIGLGTLVAAPAAAATIDRYGWRTTYVVFGMASAVLLLLCATFVRPAPTMDVGGDSTRLRTAVRTRSFRLLWASTVLLSLTLFMPFVFLVTFAEDAGIGRVAAAGLIGVIGGASIVGRLVVGPVADRVGHGRAFRVCYLVIAGSYVLWLLGSGYLVLAGFAVVLGVGYGGFVALSPAVVADLFGEEGLGALIGATYTGAAIGGLVGAPVAGVIIDATSYRPAILLFMGFGLAAWVVLRSVDRPDGEPTSPTVRAA